MVGDGGLRGGGRAETSEAAGRVAWDWQWVWTQLLLFRWLVNMGLSIKTLHFRHLIYGSSKDMGFHYFD